MLGKINAALMRLEGRDDLLFNVSITFHHKISGYQVRRSGNITLTVTQFLRGRSSLARVDRWIHAEFQMASSASSRAALELMQGRTGQEAGATLKLAMARDGAVDTLDEPIRQGDVDLVACT